MPYIQELCTVRITWLEPGEICVQGKLGANDFTRRGVLTRHRAGAKPVWVTLTGDQLVSALLGSTEVSQMECSSPDNPWVRVCVPVTIYEFDPFISPSGWINEHITEAGAEAVFGPYLPELDNIGLYLRNKGESLDRGPFGQSVMFQTLWVLNVRGAASGWANSREFCGYVNMSRVPLTLFAEKISAQDLVASALAETGGSDLPVDPALHG